MRFESHPHNYGQGFVLHFGARRRVRLEVRYMVHSGMHCGMRKCFGKVVRKIKKRPPKGPDNLGLLEMALNRGDRLMKTCEIRRVWRVAI